jgi:signal peptidase I
MTKNKKQVEVKKFSKEWFIENIKSFGLAIFLVLIIRSSFIEAFKIPSGSMIPTLLVGDHIFVNKMAYGFKVPFSDWINEDPIYITKPSQPKRGDVIVFKFPKDTSFYYIKRVIGVPGDKISIKDKVIYLNNEPLQQIEAKDAAKIIENLEGKNYDKASLEVKMEVNPTTKKWHYIMLDKNNYITENFGEIEVPSDSFFVMGDNRDFSNDSRFWGFVPFKYVRGKALFVWLSLWLDFTQGEYYFRPLRIGTIIR